MLEFDIEKVEALDFEKIKDQLQYIFKTEEDVINFVNFLKNVQKFVSLSDDKRHMLQVNLSYFKSQISLYEKKIKLLIDKKKNEQVKMAIKKAKGIGEKITENTVAYYSENNDTLDGLFEIHALVSCWAGYLNDLYFMCNQTNKNITTFN
jgi:hypothetical protein